MMLNDNDSPVYISHGTQLNADQLRYLLGIISREEHNEVKSIAKGCVREMTWKYGFPISFGIVSSLYYARSRLPPKYHFGPKGWPFYFIMGFASLTVVNVFTMGNCRSRLRPRIQELWIKYNDQPNVIGNLHQINRQESRDADEKRIKFYGSQDHSSEYTPLNSGMNQSSDLEFKSYDLMEKPREKGEQSHSKFIYEDIPPYMSGTPSGQKHDTFEGSTFS